MMVSWLGCRLTAPAFIAGLIMAFGGPAAAQWAPAPFSPALGSQWQVAVVDTTTDSLRSTSRTLSYQFDLTYRTREGDGYGILYVLRSVEAEGNAPSVAIARLAVSALKDVPVHAVTDATGMPIRVMNEVEVGAAIRALGESYARQLKDQPQLTAIIRRVFGGLANAHGAEAAAAVLDPLPLLARAQGTTLKPGEERRTTEDVESPFGGTVLSVTLSRLGPDAQPDRFSVLETETLDEASVKTAIAALTKWLAPGGMPGEDLKSRLPQVELSITKTRRVDVQDGIARAAAREETTRAGFSGQSGTRVRRMTVRVTPQT